MPILFVISIIAVAIYTIVLIVAGFQGSTLAGIVALVLSPLLFILMVIGARVYFELVIIIFRIAENIKVLAEQKQNSGQ